MNKSNGVKEALSELNKLIKLHVKRLERYIELYNNEQDFHQNFEDLKKFDEDLSESVKKDVIIENKYDSIIEEATTIQMLKVLQYRIIAAETLFPGEITVYSKYDEDGMISIKIDGIIKNSYNDISEWMNDLKKLRKFYKLTLDLYTGDLRRYDYFEKVDPENEFNLSVTVAYWIKDLIRRIEDIDGILHEIPYISKIGIKISGYGFDEDENPVLIFEVEKNNDDPVFNGPDYSYF